MALATRNEIRAEILENRDQFASDPDGACHEMADSLAPIYYGDILGDWADLSMAESDRWAEIGMDENATIMARMQTDVFLYYRDLIEEIWNEISEGLACSIGGDNHSGDFVTVYEGNEEPAIFCGYHALVRDRFAPAITRPIN